MVDDCPRFKSGIWPDFAPRCAVSAELLGE
jgi:hypothetical protein